MKTPCLFVGALLSLGARAEVGFWENLTDGAAAPLTVSIGEALPPWDFEVTFTNLVAFDQISLDKQYPQLVTLSDGSTSQNLSVNGWGNSRDLFLTGSKVATQSGTPIGNVNGNNDVGNGELWAPTNGVMTLAFSDDGTHLSVSQNGHLFLKTDKRTANGKLASLTLGSGLSQLGNGMIASARIRYAGRATVVRSHPRLTAGLERESLIGVRFSGHRAGALTNLTVRFDLTNCTPDQITDIRLWRQKYDPVPFAFFERDAVELTANGLVGSRVPRDTSLTVNFSNPSNPSNAVIYPLAEGRSESDYLWVTAKFADNLATNAEIWTSILDDTITLGGCAYAVTNGIARAPHRPFPYCYHIGAYVRQDRLVGNGSTASDIFSSNPKERFENLTDVLPIYSAHDGYSNGKFYVSGWSDGDTASTKRIVAFRDQYNSGCMVRPSLVPNNWVSANGIYGLAFEVAGAAESTRKQFASAIVAFLQAQNCDGLDIDYEWVRDGTNHREWQNIGKMLRELSEQFFDHGYVLSFAGRSHDSAQSGMPYNSADYGAFHTCDFIMSQTYGGGWLNAAPCIQRRGLAVCTSRGLPARRVVLGQAAYVSADGHPGWDGASAKVAAFTSDPLRRFDIDTWWKSPYISYWPFEGMSSLQAQCLWVRRENIGGVMSWGYYTDPTWDGWNSFGRHTSKAVWPMPWSWPTPEVEEVVSEKVKVEGQVQERTDTNPSLITHHSSLVTNSSLTTNHSSLTTNSTNSSPTYLLKTESDWFWLAEHPNVKAAFANDITLTHDPLVIDTWTGELDGRGHKLIIAKDTWIVSEKATGLIRNLQGTVRNLTVDLNGRVFTVAPRWNDATADPANVRLTNTMQGENPVGVIAAEAGDGAVIENVRVVMGAGSEVKGVKDAGGLVGKVSGAAIVTNNSVTVGGKLHLEIRNIWDTLFQPSSPSIGAVVGLITPQTIITNNTFSVVADGGEIQDLDEIPAPACAIAGDWLGSTGYDQAFPRDLDVRSSEYAVEVVMELPSYTEGTLAAGQYPQLVNLLGTSGSVALSVSGDGGGELFLTGSGTASYAHPISRCAIRGNGDVGSGVKLAPTNRVVTLLIENRSGELRIVQNGVTLLVTDKNTAADGYVRSVQLGGGISQLGGGRIISARLKLGRKDRIIHPEGYGKLVFNEEFDGDAIDWAHWEKVPDDARHIDWKKYTSHRADLYAVSNGCLVLTGAKNDGTVVGDDRKYQCGQIQSSGKFSFKYGMVEIRAKFDNQDGAWPAMWMMPQNAVHGGWPYSGEIDISERLNADAFTHQTAHFGYGDKDTTSTATAAIANDVFNIYQLEWTESKITWYVNGVETHSYSNDGSGYLKWPFDSEFYFIFSQQLEGSWVGTVDDESTLPVRMYVDYVRVWQKDDDPRKNAYLWLDAANTNTMTLAGGDVPVAPQEVVEWQSDTLTGEKAVKYTLDACSPTGPTLTNYQQSTNRIIDESNNSLNLVSFGSSSNNCDLGFTRATDLLTVVMVAKVEQSGNAFLLGDRSNYDFHRGANGEWWAAGNANANILNGRTFWNGECVTNPTSALMPDSLGMIEVHAAGGVTASQLCYDRVGNGNTPRRGGKDIAELVLFKDALGYTERLKLRKTLTDKWGLAHPNWSVMDDWVLRRENDFSAGLTVGAAFADGVGTYEFKNLKLTGGLQSSSYTLRVQEGDAVVLSGDTLNGRCCLGFDVRGGSVTFPAVSGTWYEHTTFTQSGGTVTSLATSTAQSGTGDGFMLGFNGKTMTLDISGGTFSVPNSSLNFYDPLTMNVGGTVRAKGMFRSSSNAAVVNVAAGGRLEIGSLGLKANTCTLNLNGGTIVAFEDGAAIHNDITVVSDSTLFVPTNAMLSIDGAIMGDGRIAFAGEGKVRLTFAISAADAHNGQPTAVMKVADGFPLDQCDIYFSSPAYSEPKKSPAVEIREGTLYAVPGDTDVRTAAYMWLDAARTNTMTFDGDEITEWRSVNTGGVAAAKYALSSQSPSGPTNANGIVSFGNTSANRDLKFPQSTAIRSVFMVAKVEQDGNAFVLGDGTAYDFHRGANGQLLHTGHSSANLRNGTTYWNGAVVTDATAWTLPDELGLLELHAAGDVTASQLCYDRAGNGDVPRRGGKDIAEVLVFSKALGAMDRLAVRRYLLEKYDLPHEPIDDHIVTNGETRVVAGSSFNTFTVRAGGKILCAGAVPTCAQTITFEEGAEIALTQADGSKVPYVTGFSRDLMTAWQITGVPTNAQDFTLTIVDNEDGSQTLRATRNIGSARVVRAHPLLTRGVGRESLAAIDFSGNYGGNMPSVVFRIRFENMTVDDLGDIRLYKMPYGTPYAFYAPSATDLSSNFTVSRAVSEDKHTLTLTYAPTSSGVWVYPEVAGLRDCSDRIWLTGELQNLKTLGDDARFYVDVMNDTLAPGGNAFKVESGIATAPHRLYPWRYLVTAYMRRDRISQGNIGRLSNVPEMRWPSLTHVIVSSFNVQYLSGSDSMNIYWDDNAVGAFKTLKEYRDQYHPQCRLVPSLTKGSYVSLDSQQTGTAANRYAIAHAGEKKYRAKFVKYLVAKMEEMGADGLDIDWEYPDDNGKDYNAYGLLMRDLAEAFFDHGWDLSMCSNLGYRMPGGAVMAAADYMSSMAYGANRGLHAMNTTSSTAISVLTSRNVPPRRIVVGQAIYSTAKWHMGWDELAGRCGNDDDIINENWSYNGSSGDFIGFTGPTTYRAKCNRAKGVYSDGVEYGGVMSWGYYCDTGWWSGKSLGWNQRQTIWPRPYNFPIPAQDAEGTYVITNETGWCWFSENAANVGNVRLAADIAFNHDPKPIPSFSGTLDGGGHTLTIPSGVWVVAFNHAGLFQSLAGTVKNLNIDVYGRFISRNDRLNDVQSGWTLSAHGGGGANGAVLAANAAAGARIEGVNITVRPGAEVRANHDVGALVGELWTGGSAVVVSNCTVDCAGTIWTKAVDSVNAVISTGATGDGRAGLLVGSLNFGSDSAGVTLVDCSATLRATGALKSECGNNRSLGGLVGNVHVGTNAKFVWNGLRMTYDEGATIEGPANSSRPYVCQPFFGYWYATATSSSLPTLDDASMLVRNGYAPTGFDSATWLTATSSSIWTEGANPYAGTAPVTLDEPFTNAVSTSYLTVGAVVDVPSAAGTNDLLHVECTDGFAIWVEKVQEFKSSRVQEDDSSNSSSLDPLISSSLELRLGYTQEGARTDYGVAVRVLPGTHTVVLAMSATDGTTLYVNGSAVQTVAGLKFSSNPFVRVDIGFAGVGLYAYDILPNCIGTLTYPHTATYPEFNVLEIGADDDPLKLTGITYPSSLSAATLKSFVAPATAPGPLAAWYVNRDSDNFVIEAYRNNETNTAIAWRNAGETTRNYAEQTTCAVDSTGTKTLHFTHSTANGGAVAFNAQCAASSAKTKWGGSTITGAALGLTVGTLIGERSLVLGAVKETDTKHPLDGLAEEPTWYPSSSEALRTYFRDAVVDGRGTYDVPPTEFNGEVRSGSDSARLHYFYGDAPTDEAEHELKLDAPVVADGSLALGLAGENPNNAALQLQTREALDAASAWKVAAELPAGSSERAFVLPMTLAASFYRVVLAEGVTTQVAEGMPIVSTTISQASLGSLRVGGLEGLVVQLAGSGVAEGMFGFLSLGNVAYVARVDTEGLLRFKEFKEFKSSSDQECATLTLVVPVGATNGTIRVASPAVSAIAYPDALVTEMVANTLYADGLTAKDYGWAYRIPSLVTDGKGEVLCLYDVRYGGGDLGTGSGIDIGETRSADFGRTFAKPQLAIDVPNTCNEKNESIPQSRTNDLGDVATLYDPATETYWLLGMGGRGLNVGDYYQNDVVLYKKVERVERGEKVERVESVERGEGEQWSSSTSKWEKVRSIQNEIAIQEGITNATGGLRFGFLQGPGHGFVTKIGTAAMPKGTLVFPMQYFVDGWASTVGAIYSKDHGETWTATRRSTGGTTPQENCVMELDDGSWYMMTKAGSRPGTGRINFFRTTDYTNWVYVGEHYPVPCQQGSCLRLGRNATDGKGRYALCHTLHPDTATRARVALVFGTDTTAADDAAGVAWDFDNPLMLYYGDTGFKGYNSLCMVDANTLGVLYEAQGHIYFIRIDVSDRLK